MNTAWCKAIIHRARWEILVAAEIVLIDILIFLLGGRHGAPLAQGAAGAIREKRSKKVKSDVVKDEIGKPMCCRKRKKLIGVAIAG
jgi:hypothetical protein